MGRGMDSFVTHVKAINSKPARDMWLEPAFIPASPDPCFGDGIHVSKARVMPWLYMRKATSNVRMPSRDPHNLASGATMYRHTDNFHRRPLMKVTCSTKLLCKVNFSVSTLPTSSSIVLYMMRCQWLVP